MQRTRPTRTFIFASAAFVCGALACSRLAAQSTLPPTGPTQAPAAATVGPLNATAPQMDAATRAHRAEVRYASGLISVNANNSSLNQILREISRQTGMKITGGVKDERVFGHYGPAAPADLLATLIDGTGTNMLLQQADNQAPLELVLTPRNGGATPPNPNAPGFDDGPQDEDERPAPPPQPGPPPPSGFPGRAQAPSASGSASVPLPATSTSANPSIAPPLNNVNGSAQNVTPTASQIPTTNSVPLDTLATPSTTPSSTGIVDTPNPPNGPVSNPIADRAAAIGAASQTAGSTNGGPITTGANPTNGSPVNNGAGTTAAGATPSAPNTPEQIFQQLMKMRQQQQQSGGTTTPAATTTPQ